MNTNLVSQFTPIKVRIIYQALKDGLNLSSAEAQANLPPGTIKEWTVIAKREIEILKTDCQLDPKLDYNKELEDTPIIAFYLKYRRLEADLIQRMKGVVLTKIFDDKSVKDAKWWLERYEQTEKRELEIERTKINVQRDRLHFLKLLKDIAPDVFKTLMSDANMNTETVTEILADLNQATLIEDKR